MPVVERESVLASLSEYAEAARDGDGRLVLVAGEAGVGKSTLVETLAGQLDGRWAWGICDGLFTPRPLGPLFDLANELGGELLELCKAQAPRDELFAALLRQMSEPGRLNVVVLEDVHWADEATIDLLRFLARRLRQSRLLLIATYRDEELAASDPLRIALGEFASQRTTRRIALAPLSADGVRVLAEGSPLEAAELHRLTGGNPFYVTEVIRAGTGAVPASARDAVLARVARCGAQAREVLDVAALVGSRVELGLLAAVTDYRPAVVDELLASGLLTGDATWLRFRHEIARRAVAEAVPAHRRGHIHGQILAVLRDLHADDDAGLAYHAEAAAEGEAALHYAVRAARQAAEFGSQREAAAQYERALRFANGLEPSFLAGLHDGLAQALALLDRWEDALGSWERALRLWRAAGDRLREGDTLRRMSRAWWRVCRGREAAATAGEALATLQPLGPTAELAWAYSNLAIQRMLSEHHEEAIELAAHAQELAEPMGLFGVLSDALNTVGCSYFETGRDGSRPLLLSLEIASKHRLRESAGRAYANLYAVHCRQRRFVEAERFYVDGVAFTDEHDLWTFASCLRGERSVSLAQTGQWDESLALSTALVTRTDVSPINRLNSLVSQGTVLARRGLPCVHEPLDEAATGADGSQEPQWIARARLARAEALWLEDRLTQARREVELAADVIADCGDWLRGAVAVWLRRTGSSRTLPGPFASPYRPALAGDWEAAANAWMRLGCAYDAALALFDSEEESALRRALSIFSDLGATPAVRLVRQRMRQLGVRSIPAGPRTATRAHPLGLTQREREVLDLICGGHTNAEIASRLVIATKTVDHHVSAVLAKLGAPTRTEAAAQAVRLGLVGAGTASPAPR